jgi:hypothetical protein
MDPDPDPALFVSGLLFEGTNPSFFKDKSHNKEVTKQ